jgi:chromosomal replication initiator protein
MASDEHPKMIEEFGESLVNRFVSGMVVRIDPPNFITRCEILRNLAARTGFLLTDDVAA